MKRVLEIILALVMIGATLAFGAVELVSYSLMEIALFVALFLLLLSQTWQGQIRLGIPIAPLLFALLALLQIIPVPSSWLASYLPARNPGVELARLWPQGWPTLTLSIYPHDTTLMLFKFLAYLSAFVLAAYLFDSRKRKSILVRTLILIGFSEAVYGMVQFLTGWQQIFWYTRRYFTQEATGTYINRNHYAGVLELTMPFAIAMAFYSFQHVSEARPDASPSRRPASADSTPSGFETFFYLFLAVIILVGLVFSRSRGGIMAILIALVFMAIAGYIRLARKIWALVVLFILIFVIGYGMWIGLGPVLSRFEQIADAKSLTIDSRVALFRDEIRLIHDHWAVGTGLGTFGIAIHGYQTNMVDLEIEHAHNDYFEIASDMGVPGALLIFLPIFYLFFKLMSSFLDDPRRYRRSITLACLGSTLAILIHSAVDFNLQIPSNALIFAVVLGIGYKIAMVERDADERDLVAERARLSRHGVSNLDLPKQK